MSQLPEDHSQVVADAGQHRVHPIAERAFEPVPSKFAVRLHVTEGRLDRASPANHRAQPLRDTAPQSRVVDLHALDATRWNSDRQQIASADVSPC